MKGFIELKYVPNGNTFIVNINYINVIEPSSHGALLYLSSREYPIEVKESMNEVCNLIKQAQL